MIKRSLLAVIVSVTINPSVAKAIDEKWTSWIAGLPTQASREFGRTFRTQGSTRLRQAL
jgi:hypothetical protein